MATKWLAHETPSGVQTGGGHGESDSGRNCGRKWRRGGVAAASESVNRAASSQYERKANAEKYKSRPYEAIMKYVFSMRASRCTLSRMVLHAIARLTASRSFLYAACAHARRRAASFLRAFAYRASRGKTRARA